jgi:glycosyltransferase involved in cell wall biosynthesis
LKNFLSVFDLPAEDLLIIADCVGDQTWEMVNAAQANVVRTEFGTGAGSWRHAALDVAVDWDPDVAVYFVEDDYLHLPGSLEVLREGIAVADYVSLYDHRDKYLSADAGGPNHFVAFGGEVTRLIRTQRTHWKVTNSTTMTFATTVKVLREDRDVWDRFTRRSHPMDFQAFLELAEKGRSLIVPVPGYSTHCEPKWASPGVDWAAVAEKYA